MIWLIAAAVGLAMFAAGFVLGTVYGVRSEQEAQVQRLLRMERERRRQQDRWGGITRSS